MESNFQVTHDWISLVDELMGSMPDQIFDLNFQAKEEEIPLFGQMQQHQSPMSTSLSSSSSSLANGFELSELGDLKGTTAYAARKMTPDEKQLMLLKRKIRNRESAKRSKAKKDSQIHNIQVSHEKLLGELEQLRMRVQELVAENTNMKQENEHFRNAFLVPQN